MFRDLAREAAQEEKEREERKKLEDDGVRGDGSMQTTTTQTQQQQSKVWDEGVGGSGRCGEYGSVGGTFCEEGVEG